MGHPGSSSLTRDRTGPPALGVWCLNSWTIREVPGPRSLDSRSSALPAVHCTGHSLSLPKVVFPLPESSGSDSRSVCLQYGRPRFDPWVRKIPWRRKWQPTPVLLPGKFHGQRSLVGYSPWGHKESDTTEKLHFTSLPSL